MTVSFPDEVPIYQTNTGPGTLIGRDNYGTIQTIDAKTKAILDKLSIEAPALARLLTKALKDGLISPHTASALEMAARNINGDVADALYLAGRNINWDVAEALQFAGERINSQVAQQIDESVTRMEGVAAKLQDAMGTARGLSQAAQEIRNLDETVVALDGASQNIAMAATRVSGSGWSWRSFQWGMGFCFALCCIVLALWGYASR